MDYKAIDAYLETHLSDSISELSQLCAQPSVAAQNWGLEECATLVKEMLVKRGFEVDVDPTGGAPVVFAKREGKSPKTLLIYNHYDVQPPEPLELWNSPPFEPTLRDGKLYARGVSDDKGHLVSRLFAIDAILETLGELPCTIKFIIEGEEEVSSLHLQEYIQAHKDKLISDACIWEFGGVDHRDVPQQQLGLRGICYVELSVETASMDVHSGLGGSIFPNAAWRLVWALNTLKGPDEKILIPGFYDPIVPPTARERELMKALPEVSEEYKERYKLRHFIKGLQDGVDLRMAEVMEPTCTICGLTAGYQGPGSKTVLPARASAKIDFRLVPRQTPEQVLAGLRQHLDSQGFDDIQITFLGGEPASKTDPDDPFVQMVVNSAESVYGVPMQIIPSAGGSGPGYPFKEHLNIPIVSAGIAYPGTLTHSPNENVRLDLYLKGARHMARIITLFGQ